MILDEPENMHSVARCGLLKITTVFSSDMLLGNAAGRSQTSLNDWISHTPESLVKSHLHIDQPAYNAITPRKDVVMPA